jgi:hypothetical protein
LVFAPVYFDGGLRTQRGFTYTPSAVINLDVFANHLFLRPRYGHYYFGDYYAANYSDAGFSPWFSYQSSRRGYDPIYANQRWQHRNDRDWERRTKSNFHQFRDHKDARPPHTWAAQRELEKSNKGNNAVATSLDELARQKDSRFRFQPVDKSDQQQFGQRGQAYRKYLEQRQQLEANAARKPGKDPATATGPARRNFTRSPFAAAPADQLGKNDAPPQRHVVLKPDSQVEPQPGKRGGQTGTGQFLKQRGTPGGSQQQDPKARRSSGQQRQLQGQGTNPNKRQGASNNQSNNAPRGQSSGGSKKKEKD